MKKNIIIPALVITALTTGCVESDKQNSHQDNSSADTLHQKHQEEKTGEEKETYGKPALNNGVKWQANAETTEGIHKMAILIDEHLNTGNSDNKTLGENLEKEFTAILQKCTMTGKAHEQLHNFLLPLKDMIDRLKETSSVENIKNLQHYLDNYHVYFQ